MLLGLYSETSVNRRKEDRKVGRKEGTVLFNDTLNTFLFYRYEREERKEMIYLTMHSTYFVYRYGARHMVKDPSDSETEGRKCFI